MSAFCSLLIANPYDSIESAINHHDYATAIPLLIGKKLELSNNVESNGIELGAVEGTLGTIYLNENKLDSSEKHFSNSYSFYRRDNTERSRKSLGITANNLSLVYSLQNKYRDAISVLKDAIGLMELAKSQEQKILTGLYLSLASCQKKLKQFRESNISYNRCMDIAIKAYAPNHIVIASVHNNIGELKFSEGDYNSALDSYKKAFAIYSMPGNSDSIYLFGIYTNIGKTETRLHNYESALLYLLASKSYLSLSNSKYISGKEELYEYLSEALSNINCLEFSNKYRVIADSLKKENTFGISGSILQTGP